VSDSFVPNVEAENGELAVSDSLVPNVEAENGEEVA